MIIDVVITVFESGFAGTCMYMYGIVLGFAVTCGVVVSVVWTCVVYIASSY